MAIDVKAKIDEIVNKIKSDPSLLKKFQSDPVKVIESLLGVDLPDDVCNKVIAGVKAKMTADNLAGAADKLKKLF
ncbi:MAG: hypothetical protein MJ119_00840 [Lachnospiraceae bacterium]|nr:hypothetical protein [Lachnospiraceae bacterium]